MENKNVYEKPVTLKNILKFAVPTIAMTGLESEYKLAAFAQLYSPNNNHTRYLEGISSALSECNNRIVQLTDKVLQDEMQKKALDNIREIMNRSGF